MTASKAVSSGKEGAAGKQFAEPPCQAYSSCKISAASSLESPCLPKKHCRHTLTTKDTTKANAITLTILT